MTLIEKIKDLQAQIQEQNKIYFAARKELDRLDAMLDQLLDEFNEGKDKILLS